MKKKKENTRAEEQVRLLAEVQKREAAHTIDTISRAFRLGQYADPSYKCTVGLVNLVQDYRTLAMSFYFLGDQDNSDNERKAVLRIINNRTDEKHE